MYSFTSFPTPTATTCKRRCYVKHPAQTADRKGFLWTLISLRTMGYWLHKAILDLHLVTVFGAPAPKGTGSAQDKGETISNAVSLPDTLWGKQLEWIFLPPCPSCCVNDQQMHPSKRCKNSSHHLSSLFCITNIMSIYCIFCLLLTSPQIKNKN